VRQPQENLRKDKLLKGKLDAGYAKLFLVLLRTAIQRGRCIPTQVFVVSEIAATSEAWN
jgi:hypothetical protein